MKKIICLSAAASLIAALAIGVSAADDSQIVLTAPEGPYAAGDTITVTISAENFEEFNTFMLYDPEYDQNYLEWTGGTWLLENATLSDYVIDSDISGENEQGRSAVYYADDTTVSGNIAVATMEFTVLQECETAQTVSCSVIVKNDTTVLSDNVEVTPVSVTLAAEEEPAVTYSYGQSAQIRLIEPWGLKANIKVSADGTVVDYSSLYDYGAYFIRASQLDKEGLTVDTIAAEDIINDSEAVVYTKDTGVTVEGQFLTAIYDKGLYTYEFSDSVFVMFYTIAEEGDAPVYAPIRERNLSSLINTRKDDTTGSFTDKEKEVYKYMAQLETDITNYRADFTDLSKSADQKAPTLAEYSLGTTASVNAYTFGHSVQIRLIEPWGMKVNARATLTDGGTIADYSSLNDYGVIILFDGEKEYTAEELIANKNAYVFSHANGDASLDGNFITAIYNKDLFTYQLNTNAYVIFYVEDENGVHYGPIKERNLYSLMQTRAVDTSGDFTEKEKAVYADMVNLHDAVTAYRSDFQN